jgi:hypothetical protein
MKELICKAFCDSITVTELPKGIGFGLSSSMFEAFGDLAGVYAIGPDRQGKWRLDDSGWVAPMLTSSGFDLGAHSKFEVFLEIVSGSGLEFDADSLEIYIDSVNESDVPAAAIKFFSTLTRIAELAKWTTERIRSNFRADVAVSLRQLLPDIQIKENAPADARVPDLLADLVLEAPSQRSVALYLAQSDVSLLEAMLLKAETAHLTDRPKVVAIMEREKSAPQKIRTRAHNRLDIVTVYEGDSRAAVQRIADEVVSRVH